MIIARRTVSSSAAAAKADAAYVCRPGPDLGRHDRLRPPRAGRFALRAPGASISYRFHGSISRVIARLHPMLLRAHTVASQRVSSTAMVASLEALTA